MDHPATTARRALIAAGLGALMPACQADASNRKPGSAGEEPRKMAQKEPEPPASTLAFREHVDKLMLSMSIVYSHKPDRDFAALLSAQRRGLAQLAQLELKHGTDPEMRAIAQRIVDAHAAEDAALQAWRKRQTTT